MAGRCLVLILVAFVVNKVKGENKNDNSVCNFTKCRAGRECKMLGSGIAVCTCVETCPDHFVPVCGSNGISYENHCLLHRDACLRQTHISIKHKGYCKNGSLSKKKHSKDKRKPVVCYQQERDRMRELIVEKLKCQLDKELPGSKSYQKIVKKKFDFCNTDNDSYLDSSELLECIKENQTLLQVRSGENSDLISALCIDAIIEAADLDSDWLLNFNEFKTCMNPNFQPEEKLCTLEGKQYDDGAETTVDCNNCVCACGNWVCTSSSCSNQTSEDFKE